MNEASPPPTDGKTGVLAPAPELAFLRALIAWKIVKGIALIAAAAALAWPGDGAIRMVEHLAAWLSGRGPFLRAIGEFASEQATNRNVTGAALFSAGAAIVAITEGIGLSLRRRWAAWLTVIATSSLIPIELYQLFHKFRAGALVLLVANLCVVLYLTRLARRHASLWLG